MSKQTTIEHLVKFPEILGELKTTGSQDLITVNSINQVNKMSKQTAVDYLFNELIANPGNFIKACKQAKEMEKEQIVEAVNYGCSDWGSWKDVEQYYNETYNKDK
jgi:hypothetical protein